MLSKHGQWLGGTIPLGMTSYKVADKTANAHSKFKFYLKENEKELEIINEIYSKFLEYQSLTKTKEYLKNSNVRRTIMPGVILRN